MDIRAPGPRGIEGLSEAAHARSPDAARQAGDPARILKLVEGFGEGDFVAGVISGAGSQLPTRALGNIYTGEKQR